LNLAYQRFMPDANDPTATPVKLDADTVQRLEAAEQQLTTADREIRAAAEKCGRGEDCAPAGNDVSRIDVSFLPRAPVVQWYQLGRNEQNITLDSAGAVSEIYIRPSRMTGIPGVGDEPSFTRKIWSSDPSSEVAIVNSGIISDISGLRDFLILMDRSASKVTSSGSKISISIKPNPHGGANVLYRSGQAPPVTQEPILIVNDRFGRTFTLDFNSPRCPEAQRCAMDDL
jgi:hypothetical protein